MIPREINLGQENLRILGLSPTQPEEPFSETSSGIYRELRGSQGIILQQTTFSSKVPEGHQPRGTTLREALRGNLPLRGLCGGLSEGSAGSLRGLRRVSPRAPQGLSRDFPRVFGGSDHMLVTLGNCWMSNRNQSKKSCKKSCVRKNRQNQEYC